MGDDEIEKCVLTVVVNRIIRVPAWYSIFDWYLIGSFVRTDPTRMTISCKETALVSKASRIKAREIQLQPVVKRIEVCGLVGYLALCRNIWCSLQVLSSLNEFSSIWVGVKCVELSTHENTTMIASEEFISISWRVLFPIGMMTKTGRSVREKFFDIDGLGDSLCFISFTVKAYEKWKSVNRMFTDGAIQPWSSFLTLFTCDGILPGMEIFNVVTSTAAQIYLHLKTTCSSQVEIRHFIVDLKCICTFFWTCPIR